MKNFASRLRACIVLVGLTGHYAAALPAQTEAVSTSLSRTTSSISISTVPISTVTKDDEIIQIPARPTKTPDEKKLGYYPTDLDMAGHASVQPFPTENPSSVGSIDTALSKTVAKTSYTTAMTVSGSFTPLEKRAEETPAPKARSFARFWNPNPEETKAEEGEVEARGEGENIQARAVSTISNIFVPIATTTPIALFSRRPTHPVPRTGIVDTNRPVHTNKFYANLFLGGQTNSVWTFPYQFWFNKTDPTWGFSFNHPNPDLRGYGSPMPPSGAVEFYVNPIFIRSLQLSATEFNNVTSTMELKNLNGQSVDVYFYANKASSSTKYMYTPLCLGQGFVSAVYSNLTPVFNSAVLVRSLSKSTVTVRGATKYTITLEDGSVWLLYSFPNGNTAALSLTLVNNGVIKANSAFTGLIQIAKLSPTTAGNAAAELLFDAAAGSYCTGVTVTGSAAGSTGNYQLNFVKAGPGSSELLMYALPHHVDSFSTVTKAKVKSTLQLPSTTKGMMTGVIANQWSLVESSMPTNYGFLPVMTSGTATISAANLKSISTIATSEIAQDMNAQSNLDSMYFSGKALAKFAYVCLTANDVLKDKALATTCLNKLKTAYSRFLNNQQTYKLVYDQSWSGIVSNALYVTGDPLSDFGSGYYNDHHFHYGYFIQAAAIIGHLDAALSASPTWVKTNKEYVNTLVRDVANPSTADNSFPVFRSFDWFHGHSWAKGIFESADGKDQESSSEDYNFAYAMKLWGNVVGDAAMEARGNLMLAVMRRSMNFYYLLSTGNTVHPANFVGNKVAGILFENKVHHTTYFGALPQYIQGIHMLPLTPIMPYIRGPTFVQQEWSVYFDGKTSTIADGWKGVLYGNKALFDPKESWKFFIQSGFDSNWLDGGASRTWYLTMAAGLGGSS